MSRDWSSVSENIRSKKTAEATQAELADQNFTRGYQAGYKAAKKEVFEHMQAFLNTDAK